MDRDEMREEITNLLLQSETVDKEPPFRILPQGNNGWAEIKAGRLLSLLAPVFEKAGKWDALTKKYPHFCTRFDPEIDGEVKDGN